MSIENDTRRRSAKFSGFVRQVRAYLHAIVAARVLPSSAYGDELTHLDVQPPVPRRDRMRAYAGFAWDVLRRRADGRSPWRTLDDLDRARDALHLELAERSHLDLARFVEEHGIDLTQFHPTHYVLVGPCPFDHAGQRCPGWMTIDPRGNTWRCASCGLDGTARDFVARRYNLRGTDLDRYMADAVARAISVTNSG